MSARQGRVFVISSPSGGGKTTVVAQLRRAVPGLARSVSVTTRAPRIGERQGRDYRFISDQEFARLQRRGELLEWARVHGACYGTPRGPIERTMSRGRSVILSIDVKGARQVRRVLKEQAVLIFLLPPSLSALRQRLERRRTETASAIRVRLAAAKRELACARWYDFTVVNDEVRHAVAQLAAIVRASLRAPHRAQRRKEGMVDVATGDR